MARLDELVRTMPGALKPKGLAVRGASLGASFHGSGDGENTAEFDESGGVESFGDGRKSFARALRTPAEARGEPEGLAPEIGGLDKLGDVSERASAEAGYGRVGVRAPEALCGIEGEPGRIIEVWLRNDGTREGV